MIANHHYIWTILFMAVLCIATIPAMAKTDEGLEKLSVDQKKLAQRVLHGKEL